MTVDFIDGHDFFLKTFTFDILDFFEIVNATVESEIVNAIGLCFGYRADIFI